MIQLPAQLKKKHLMVTYDKRKLISMNPTCVKTEEKLSIDFVAVEVKLTANFLSARCSGFTSSSSPRRPLPLTDLILSAAQV